MRNGPVFEKSNVASNGVYGQTKYPTTNQRNRIVAQPFMRRALGVLHDHDYSNTSLVFSTSQASENPVRSFVFAVGLVPTTKLVNALVDFDNVSNATLSSAQIAQILRLPNTSTFLSVSTMGGSHVLSEC